MHNLRIKAHLPLSFALLLLLWLRWEDVACCEQIVIDQRNDPSTNAMLWLEADSVAQEFVPSNSLISFVEAVVNTDPNYIQLVGIEVRHLSVSGTVVAATSVQAPMGSPGVVRFLFASPVSLTPGDVYVMRVINATGNGRLAVGIDHEAGYSAGRFILGGEPQNFDLWFREGFVVLDGSELNLSISSPPRVAVSVGSVSNKYPTQVTFSLEFSDDLITWQSMPNIFLPFTAWTWGHTYVFEDQGLPAQSRRFYRGVLLNLPTSNNASSVRDPIER